MKHWQLYLVPNIPGGRWISGLLLLVALSTAFSLSGAFDFDPGARSAALFFVCMCAYMPPITHYIVERSEIALRNLDKSFPGLMDVEEEVHAVRHESWKVVLIVAAASLALGLVHNLALARGPEFLWRSINSGPAPLSIVLGTFAVWWVTTSALTVMIRISRRFARLAKKTPINLLDTGSLMPFGRAGVNSTLAVIGSLSFFPLLFVGNDSATLAFYPGFIGALISLAGIVSLSMWPIHKALTNEKRIQLEAVDEKVRAKQKQDIENPETLASLTSLLAYRRELREVSEWPIDVSVVARFALYAIIPPLTWVGAALIENLVDVLLK